VNKSWQSVLNIGCKQPFNLMKLIQTNIGFQEELEEFEGSFEQDEIVDIYNVEKKFTKFHFFVQFCSFETL
jgi:hypothetical protein